MPKILIIDDEPAVLNHLTAILEQKEYEVVTASNGTEGTAMLRSIPNIGVVITEAHLPDMMGIGVVRALRDLNPDMAVIILTGQGDMSGAVSAMKEGAFDYLTKPVDAAKLLITLENAVRRHALQEENRSLVRDNLKNNAFLQGLHDSAQQILMNLIPSDPPPQFKGVGTAAIYKSCDHVGGDMYDFFELGNRVFFYLFDVCSHGILAAVITMIIKSFFDNLKRLQAYANAVPNLSELAQDLNLEMIQNTPSNMFASLFAGCYDRDTRTVSYVSCGHIDQYLLHDGQVVKLSSTGTLIGLFESASYEVRTLPISYDDKLLLFTDGLTEVWQEDQTIGSGRTISMFVKYGMAPINELLSEIYGDIMKKAGKMPLEDDLTIVGLAFPNPSPHPGTSLFWRSPENTPPRSIRDILRNELRCSGTVIRRLRKPGCILVDGLPARVIDRMESGSLLEALMTEPDDSSLLPEEIPLVVLYEDDHLIAVDKTDSIAVHPSALHRHGTLANAVAWHFSLQGRSQRVRPVTRLDRNTSGVTLFAKTAHAQYELGRQSKAGQFRKNYLGICLGAWQPENGTITLPIRRSPSSIIEREAHQDGDACLTRYETAACFETERGLVSLLRFIPETGRTHQIRVHCAASGHPIIGDTLYGGPLWPGLAGQALHCDSLSFLHPITREPVFLQSLRTAPLFHLDGLDIAKTLE